MLLQPSPFLERIVRFLMPFFTTDGGSPDEACSEILDTLASYGARTRSELLNAAQIIAFSFATLEALAQAQTPDLSHSMRLRYRASANGLNRAGQQQEKALAKRLSQDVPAPATPAAEPINDTSDSDTEALLQKAQADIARVQKLYPSNPHMSTKLPAKAEAQSRIPVQAAMAGVPSRPPAAA